MKRRYPLERSDVDRQASTNVGHQLRGRAFRFEMPERFVITCTGIVYFLEKMSEKDSHFQMTLFDIPRTFPEKIDMGSTFPETFDGHAHVLEKISIPELALPCRKQ